MRKGIIRPLVICPFQKNNRILVAEGFDESKGQLLTMIGNFQSFYAKKAQTAKSKLHFRKTLTAWIIGRGKR
ncbi:hypothetical protein [Bacillus sp. V2I10]|uniref:hypothetical protein n=1 Tax=Bacillus sp. V2I10 TaxID=3042276 RepID=UPI00278A0D3F|nr:hypothetical protein [Bacillus sp. V2I10]MDQ0858799.1 hypothetical protein [Bacillus sp. V2I10]